MPATLYGDGSLFGDADAIFGRIGSQLAVAQAAQTRETGLKVTVIDTQLNGWEGIVTARAYEQGLALGLYLPLHDPTPTTDPANIWYRGTSSMCLMTNGNIKRIRIGDPSSASDRQLWHQTITDPTNPAQWTSWAVLYSGTHYQAQVVSDGAGSFHVIHSKFDGLYVDNVKKVDNSGDLSTDEKALTWIPIANGDWRMGWVVTVKPHIIDHNRVITHHFTGDVTDVSNLSWDNTINYNHIRMYAAAIIDPADAAGTIHRIVTNNMEYNSRDGDHGQTVWYGTHPGWDLSSFEHGSAPYPIRGLGGGAGKNWGAVASIIKCSDGFFYAFGTERHEDKGNEGSTSLGIGFPVWARSKDLKHWSDWTIGPMVRNGGSSNVVEKDGYLYWAEIETVYRRPVAPVIYDVSNYVPTVEFELPRDNQAGSGSLTVANPDGINDAIKALSDREITIQPGLRVADGGYEYTTFDRFFIKKVDRQVKGEINRLSVQFGNIWTRLDNSFRDVTNFVGKTIWDDFKVGARNKAFNYYFKSDQNPSVDSSSHRLTTRGLVLYTGWKGQNPDITVRFSHVSGTKSPRVIARYLDTDNYVFLEYLDNTLYGYERVKGIDYPIFNDVVGVDATPKIRLFLRWDGVDVWFNDIYYEAIYYYNNGDGFRNTKPGYVGFSASKYDISDFHLEDWEANLTFEDLARTALALGDFHDVVIGGLDQRAYAIVWGPQTDLNSPAAALAQVLETSKSQLIFRNGFVEIGQFHDLSSVRTIQNEIIESDDIDEANRRINFASVDGNDTFWMQIDSDDLLSRDRMIVGYFDLPELMDLDAVQKRALEEINRGTQGLSPGGTTPLFFDLCRMDAITWIDGTGTSRVARIEGFKVAINQSTSPSQRQTFDTSLFPGSNTDVLDPPVTDT